MVGYSDDSVSLDPLHRPDKLLAVENKEERGTRKRSNFNFISHERNERIKK